MAHAENSYYVPHGTRWPFIGSVALFGVMTGASTWLNGASFGPFLFAAGFGLLIYMVFGWFGQVIGESEGGYYNKDVDTSFRMGMGWFIFSEVMFFSAFFGAMFYARGISIPWLGGASNNFFTNALLWPSFTAAWPTNGPGDIGGAFEAMRLGRTSAQHRNTANQWRYANDCPPCNPARPAQDPEYFPGRHVPPGLHIHGFSGL